MDFEDTPDEATFRAEARAFLEANAERRKPGEVEGYRRGQDEPGAIVAAQAFQAKKHAAGFAGIAWPTEWGGRGGTPIQQVIYSQEEAKYKVLSNVFGIGLAMAIPTICTWVRRNIARGSPRRRCAAMRSGASCSPNRRAGRTWHNCARGRNETVMDGLSTGRRSGPRGRTIVGLGFWWRAPIRMCRSTRG